ncbi:hypothetical protein V8C42DRAFT_335734 [Trichoderma barbatum]
MLHWRHTPQSLLFLPFVIYYLLVLIFISMYDILWCLNLKKRNIVIAPRGQYHALRLPWALITAANPGMPNGGIWGESKSGTIGAILSRNPTCVAGIYLLRANTLLYIDDRKDGNQAERSGDQHTTLSSNEATKLVQRFESLLHSLNIQETLYPIVLKPDVGAGGRDVSIIRGPQDALSYLKSHHQLHDLIVQKYTPGPKEVGIFYYHNPWSPDLPGKILSIVSKHFPVIYGDGKSSLRQLIYAMLSSEYWDQRTHITASTYLRQFSAEKLARIPAMGKAVTLTEIGNNSQGSIFTDSTELLCTRKLADRIHEISKSFAGFHIGRYDIRYENDEDLKQGCNFNIVELNGVGSVDIRVSCADTSLLRYWYLTCVVITKATWIAWWNVRVHGARALSVFELVALVWP